MPPKLDARRRLTYLVPIVLLVLALPVGSAAAATETVGETFVASVSTGGEPAETGVGQNATITADGRLVAFTSGSTNLAPEATAWDQAYVKNLETGALTLASRASGPAGEPAADPAGRIGVERPTLSADGRYLLFRTSAENLVAGLPTPPPVPPVPHVYRRDLRTGETEIVDRADGAAGEVLPTEGFLWGVSADGNLVAFADKAEGLDGSTGARPGEETLYVRDLANATTTEIAAEGAEEGTFSADWRYLLFTSAASGLSPEANGDYEVYRRDLETGETALVSRGNASAGTPRGEPADGEAFEATFVGGSDCRVAFFAAGTSNLTATGEDPSEGIYLHDFCGASPTTELLSLGEEGEELEEVSIGSATEDGLVAFEGSSEGGPRHLYLRDPATATSVLLDRASGADGEPAGRAVGGGGMVSANGCRALFVSDAPNLLAGEPSLGGPQAFVRQLGSCASPAAEPEPEAQKNPGPVGQSGGGPASGGSPSPARSVTVTGLGRHGLWLAFDGAGRARVRIQRQARGGGWKLVKSLLVAAAAPDVVEARLPALRGGRYRFKLRLQGDPDNPTLTRKLRVAAPRLR